MKKRVIILITIILMFKSYHLMAYPEISLGIYSGVMPVMGGSMGSYAQSNTLGVSSGIDNINRSMDGVNTSETDRLVGVIGGGDCKIVLLNYLLIRAGANYVKSFYGGEGKTLDLSDQPVTTNYTMWVYDFPLTIGLSIPFWKDVRISLSGGLAYAYGNYSNRFKSAALNSSASFSGWALPVVFILGGEHFLTNTLALSSNITYYMGSTKIISVKGAEYAGIDFSGYRWTIGFSIYFSTGSSPVK